MSDDTDNTQFDRVLGVLGGMGPEATVDFMDKLVTATPAEVDQDHIETVVYNDPKIPDRNQAILEGAESPLPRLKRNVNRLEELGVDVLALPCNTAHYYFEDLASESDAALINMISRTREVIEEMGIESAGLLATETVMEAGVYDDEFAESPVDLVEPADRDALMSCIYDIKRKNHQQAQDSYDEVIRQLMEREVSCLIVGCTDLALLEVEFDIPVVDTTSVLVDACIDRTRA
ncbi:cysteate racemase [Halobacterium rubrum]|uniref:aspartate/glutamate racemase family protein n=1 Tax=Halobacterium TaxID=2239 RepID=UPI001F00EC03|nr:MULTISPECIES: amino acid racemase [Halobacterium]MDH5021362.1 amino acid racemase [Halobacterium rubrum]